MKKSGVRVMVRFLFCKISHLSNDPGYADRLNRITPAAHAHTGNEWWCFLLSAALVKVLPLPTLTLREA